jgi:hypothetical protein
MMVNVFGDGDLVPVRAGEQPFALSNPMVVGNYP